MPLQENNTKAFFALVRAGLWEKEAWLSQFGKVDYNEIMHLAEEQSVDGLVTAGLEHVKDVKVPQEVLLQFIGTSLQIEQRSMAMNKFIAGVIEKMRQEGIYTLLVKGQGIAQCYERPLWRASGDIDLLLSNDNYQKSIDFLLPLSTFHEEEGRYSKHLGLSILEKEGEQKSNGKAEPWWVELHGTLRTGLSARVDELVDEIQRDVFYGGNVRSWQNGRTTVFLPAHDNDVVFVFTHFLMHFYRENMTLRQVCDWCRLLWTFRGKIDVALLEKRLKRAGLIDEWRGFAAVAVGSLGMPKDAMPMYSLDNKWRKKGEKILNYIMEGYSGKRISDTIAISKIFPYKTLCYLPSIFLNVNWLKLKERLLGDGDR